MKNAQFRCGPKFWIAGGGLFAVVTALVAGVAAMSVSAGSDSNPKANHATATAWYAENAQTTLPAKGQAGGAVSPAAAVNYAEACPRRSTTPPKRSCPLW